MNLTLRQASAPLARKTSSFCKDRERMRQLVVLFQAFNNMARPHMSLGNHCRRRSVHATAQFCSMAGVQASDGGRHNGSRLDLA